MKRSLLAFCLAMASTTGAQADFISGDMQLRDAIYIYGKSIHSYFYTELVGYNCDVMQMVLDVESGHTDILTSQGSDSYVPYPDTIQSWHSMFAYAMYRDEMWKWFTLTSHEQTQPDSIIGNATVFGYCYSTKPDAEVYVWDENTNTCTYSDGFQYTPCIVD